MNDDESSQDDGKPMSVKRDPRPSTPFEYPFVSPAFLFILGLWFGYDGFINPETKSVQFNRIVFGLLMLGAAWTLKADFKLKKIQDARKAEALAADADDGDSA